MKFFLIFILILSSISCTCENAEKEKSLYQMRADNEESIVFNEHIANKIATILLHGIYGEQQIEKQRPFNIELKNDEVWVIRGTKPIHTFGGLFYIEIAKKDAKVLGYFHTR